MKFNPAKYKTKKARIAYAEAIMDARIVIATWANLNDLVTKNLDDELYKLEHEAWKAASE